MKTYTRTITKDFPLLEIRYDTDAECPREWDNLGIFISKSLPDDKNNAGTSRERERAEALDAFMLKIYNDNDFDSAEEHIAEAEKQKPNYWIFPINKYEHGSISLAVGVSDGWDNTTTGFYFVEKNGEAKDYGREKIVDIIAGEMEAMTDWLNGEVVSYTLFDDKGEVVDSCGGFYGIDDIKEHLPEEVIGEILTPKN